MTPVGIARWGVYLPRNRLALGESPAEAGPERTVAGFDEDTVTLGVAAARDCLQGYAGPEPESILFASTSTPYAEKQSAALAAAALGLIGAIRTADITGSLRAGSDALQQACDMVGSGSVAVVLVIVADCRMAAPGSARENQFGDAAVAFLVSGSPVAVLQSRYLRSDSLLDSWRLAGDRFQHGWEDRFVTLHGFREPLLPLLREAGADAAVQHLALAAPDARVQRDLAMEVGLQDSLVPGLWGQVGHCGTALSALLLVAALERAAPADGLLQADYGDGATVLRWRCVARAPRQVLTGALARRRRITDYRWYLRTRDLLPAEYPPVIDQGIPATVHFRERAEDLGLIGQRCECGTHQFPRGRICQRCGAADVFVPQRYADAAGSVVTYTHDAFFPSPEPPTTAAIVQIEEGPRIHMQVADINSRDVVIGLPVRFVFRCIHRSGGKPNYFWKAVPADAGGEV